MASNYNAVIKLFEERDKKNSKWKDILEDIFWPLNTWPKHLVLNLYNCEYSDRISIISFLYKNAFPDLYAFDLIQFYAKPSRNGTSWAIRERELKSVWEKCKNISLSGCTVDKEKYFFYSMYKRMVFNYAGQLKIHGKAVAAKKENIEQNQKLSDKEHFKLLLNAGEEFELIAGELAAEAAIKCEKEVLEEILDEIRNST